MTYRRADGSGGCESRFDVAAAVLLPASCCAGGLAPIAVLNNRLALTAADFLVI